MAEPDEWVGTQTAAQALRVDRTTLWRWYRAGLVVPKIVTLGGQPRWDVESLRNQLAERKELFVSTPSAPEPQPVAAAIVTSPLGVLVTRRHDGNPPWGFITGEIEPGESPEDAAVREAKEEAGIEVHCSRVVGRRVHPRTGRTMIYLACVPVGATDVFIGDTAELAEVRWAGLDEAGWLLPTMYEPVKAYLTEVLSK